MYYLNLFIKSVLASNIVLTLFLGLCPFIGVSKKTKDAIGMGAAVIFVMTLASLATSLLDALVLKPVFAANANALRLVLHTVSFILVIATLVQLVEMAILKYSEPLYEALGIYLPLITTNCAVLGVTMLGIKDYGDMSASAQVIQSTISGFFIGIGFLLAMFLMSGIRERLALSNLPRSFRNVPIAFVCASLMALAFMGFIGLKLGSGQSAADASSDSTQEAAMIQPSDTAPSQAVTARDLR